MKSIAALIALSFLVTSCQDSVDKPEPEPAAGLMSRLEFAEATPATEASLVRVLGQVVVPANAQWVVGPSVEARLVSWSVSTGSRIKVGDTLATLVSPELGDLASVANELRRVVGERQKNVTRLKESVDAGFKSSASLYEADLSLNEARAQLQRVQRQLGVRNTNIRRGQKSQWEWVSPVDGLVTAIDCAPGGLYSAESRCITIVADDATRLRVDVSEGLVARIGDQTPKAHWTPAGATKSVTLELERRDAGFDAQSRTQAFFFSGPGLTVGASGPVDLGVVPPVGAVAVPRMSVVQVQGEPVVFVEKDGAEPELTKVHVVGRDGANTLVTGLAPASRVVSRGAFALKSVLAFE